MKTKNLIEGLILLQSYFDKDGYNVGCEHDALYVFPTDNKLSAESLVKIIELGWHQEHDDVDYNTDFSTDDYRHNESWIYYT